MSRRLLHLLFTSAILCIVLGACSKEKQPMAKAIKDRNKLPLMATYGMTTLISDSGITQYRIKAREWLVYDKVIHPYWAFNKGIYLEKFDSTYHVTASIKADTATYLTVQKIWRLKGHVKIKNIKGDKFTTSELFWNQNTQKVFSKKFIRIEQKDKVITGHGFESNQELTVYTIHKTVGHVSFDEKKLKQSPPQKQQTPQQPQQQQQSPKKKI